jgi:hypothetical protein
MGGLGSGWQKRRKPAADGCHAIDTADLRRWNLLVPGTAGRSGSFTWRRGDEKDPAASVGYVLTVGDRAGTLRLLYSVGEPQVSLSYSVQLVTTGCHLGGVRWWFVCPLSVDGVACGRRVRKLYLHGKYFGCRRCHGLSYQSSQESDRRVYAALRGGLALGRLADPGRLSVAQLGFALKVLTFEQRRLDRLGRRLDRHSRRRTTKGMRTVLDPRPTREETTMTSLAKIEANQRNAALSTGPRTAEGKAAVARNATRHGIFAAVPVLPGESHEEWDAHRTGVVESLAPAGLLEVNLAERAALLLWRLQRLARYEAETVAAAMESVDVPPVPAPKDEDDFLDPPTPPMTRDEQLRAIRRELRTAREELAEVAPARDYLRSPQEPGAAVPYPVAESILAAACGRAEAAEDLQSDPPEVGGKPFLRKLGLAGKKPEDVGWTAAVIGRGLALYAGYARESPERFRQTVLIELEAWAEELERKVRRLEGEAAAVARLLDGGKGRQKAARLLPGDGRDERIAKYERHLHGLLTSTLHELERLQARRGGEPLLPPAVADVTVTVEAGVG